MKQRSILGMIFLTIITFGIYTVYWMVSTKNEMNRLGARIPTAWLLLVPLVSIYWSWKYCEGVGYVTRKELSGPVAFLLIFMLSLVGILIIQSFLNKVEDTSVAAQLPQARVA